MAALGRLSGHLSALRTARRRSRSGRDNGTPSRGVGAGRINILFELTDACRGRAQKPLSSPVDEDISLPVLHDRRTDYAVLPVSVFTNYYPPIPDGS